MKIFLHNSLTKRKEEFKPIEPNKVSMYHCGPTVYDFIHIGNLRAFINADILRRVFEYAGYRVRQVMNITDVGHLSGEADEGEDKMTKALRRHEKPMTLAAMKEVGEYYMNAFLKDADALHIKRPHHLPKASEHIEDDIDLIKELEKAGVTYITSDGVYFDTSKSEHYGKLGGLEASEEHSRIGVSSEKRNPRDFALWKFAQTRNGRGSDAELTQNQDGIGWESPWGKGFPGWHIECSAMSRAFLGQPFDIHTGGTDLAATHHNNEIAQSECAYGAPLANYWLHNEFVNVSGGKMAKSEGTGITLRTISDEGYSPLAFRLLVLNAHYRSPIAFSFDALDGAQTSLLRAHKEFIKLGDAGGEVSESYKEEFTRAVSDDLNTPKALAVFWKVMDDKELAPADKRSTLLDFDTVLGLGLGAESAAFVDRYENRVSMEDLPDEVRNLISEREAARAAQNYDRADQLRERIRSAGYEVEDTSEGASIRQV